MQYFVNDNGHARIYLIYLFLGIYPFDQDYSCSEIVGKYAEHPENSKHPEAEKGLE